MKLVKQKRGLNLKIVSDGPESGSGFRKHGELFPSCSIRSVFCGSSGCGKTCLMMALLEHEDALKFANVYVYSKSLYQPKYQRLKKLISGIPGMGYYEFEDQILPVNEVKFNSVIIFDDVACENQDEIRNFYSMGRHRNLDMFYLTQTYTKCPKHLLRDNFNFLVLFKQDQVNLKHVFEEHVIGDMKFPTFLDMCSKCWAEGAHQFLVIDKTRDLEGGRYRKVPVKMSDPNVIGDLIETRKSIKRKFQDLQRGLINEGIVRDLTFKPITKPLQELVSETKKKGLAKKIKNGEPSADATFKPMEEDVGDLMDDPSDRTILEETFVHEEEEEEKKTEAEKGEEEKKNDGDDNEDDDELFHSILDVAPPPPPVTKTTDLPIQKRGFSDIFEEKLGKLSGPYFKLFMESPKETDPTFGIYVSENEKGSMIYKIGDTPVSVEGDVITLDHKSGAKKIRSSAGLLELLVKKKSNHRLYDAKDLGKYKQILELTNAHRVGHCPEGRIKSSGSEKYVTVISPLFYPKGEFPASAPGVKGSGLRFWRDPNKLVQRLILLNSSKLAGNTAHEAEILSIEEELREANFIY